MDLLTLLERDGAAIVDEASEALGRSHREHYREIGPDERRKRLQALFDVVKETITTRDLRPIMTFGEDLAQERYDAGVDIGEVQTAFNVLEESIWRHLVANVPADELPAAIGFAATALGVGKDALARSYVALASQRHVPSLDMRALFDGTQTKYQYNDPRP
jgi:hypothetical protein